jgi:hypothetical protein
LELAISFNGGEPTQVVLKDVLAVEPPGVVVLDDEGARRLVDVIVEAQDEGTFVIDFTVSTLVEDRRGRLTPELQADPRVTVRGNEPATFTQGTRIPYMEDGEVRFYERNLSLRAKVVE